jgi:hypothetical protein
VNCPTCGRDDGHYIGCDEIAPQVPLVELRLRTRESECIKDGCTEPRAASKGPRPTKYCEKHKTGSKR